MARDRSQDADPMFDWLVDACNATWQAEHGVSTQPAPEQPPARE